MIHSIRGTIAGLGAGFIRLECNGIEWTLEASAQSVSSAPRVGEQAKIYTWLYVREDAIKLFGFTDAKERRVFLDLLSVNGVGPRQALKMLSAARSDDIVRMLEQEDTAGLSRLPGLGKKTAAKIVLQLRGALSEETPPGERQGSGGPLDDVTAGLVEMGYDRAKAAEAVSRAQEQVEAEAVDERERERELFRRAILILG
ncbi:MAG: Holliday junction branch migration protein RuvA [Spirochaetales bacterium]